MSANCKLTKYRDWLRIETSVTLQEFNFINFSTTLICNCYKSYYGSRPVNVITYSINQHAYGRCLRAARYVDTYVRNMRKIRIWKKSKGLRIKYRYISILYCFLISHLKIIMLRKYIFRIYNFFTNFILIENTNSLDLIKCGSLFSEKCDRHLQIFLFINSNTFTWISYLIQYDKICKIYYKI